MKAVLPENIDLFNHTNEFIPRIYGVDKYNNDHALYILSQITLIPLINKDIEKKIENGFVPLYSVKLQSKVHNYKQYINYFIVTNIIETDGIYVSKKEGKEGKSYGYRFTSQYQSKELNYIEYSKVFNLKVLKAERRKFFLYKEEYGHLLKWIYPSSDLLIDSPTALSYITDKRNAQITNPSLLDKKSESRYKNSEFKDPIEQFNYSAYNIYAISSNKFNFSIDSTVNRLYTPISSLNSVLRNLVTYKNKTLYSIDIRNSQPYISLILLNNNFYKKNNIINIYNIFNKSILNIPFNPPMLEELGQMSNNEDVKLFKSLVSNLDNKDSDLYSFMQTKCKEYNSRDEAKLGMFEVLFTKNGYSSPAKKTFKRLFPTIDHLFRNIKKKDYKALSCLLQRIESNLVLKQVTRTISEKYPSAPIYTIHDSIVTIEEYKDLIHDIIYKELNVLIGLPPMLKVEKWSSEYIDYSKYA